MGSAKLDSATYNMQGLLRDWDIGTKDRRAKLLSDFILNHQNKSGPEIESEMAQMASLFLARVSVWMKLTYVNGTCLTEQLQCLHVFLSASSSHGYLTEFLEHGGVLCLLEIISLKQSKEIDKNWAIKVLNVIANAGMKYKEIICESYGIRAVAECLAKSKSEETQESCRMLLLSLADGNPRYVDQVYKGLIGVLPCTSPKAQQISLHMLRIVQPMVKAASPVIVDRVLALFQTLHLEVQAAAIEMVRDLMSYSVKDDLLRSLVQLLIIDKEEEEHQRIKALLDQDKDLKENQAKSDHTDKLTLPVHVQQASAAKCIKILCQESVEISEKLIQLRVIHNLLKAMGNMEFADCQRQASLAVEYFCRTFPIVDEHVREAMGQTLYDQFMSNSEYLYTKMTLVQADVLLSNKVNIPGDSSMYPINDINEQE